jgi:hypothetical protein
MSNQNIRFVSGAWIEEDSNGLFTKSARRAWDHIEGAPKSVKLGGSANSPRAYVESEYLEYKATLVERRAQARAAASESGRKAGMCSAATRAALVAEKRALKGAQAIPMQKQGLKGATANPKQATT